MFWFGHGVFFCNKFRSVVALMPYFPVVSPIKNIYPAPSKNTEKFAFFQNILILVLASLSWPSGILQKSENLFCRCNRRYNKQISHLTSKCWPGGLFCNFSLYVKLCGGGDPPLQSNTEIIIWRTFSKRLRKPERRLNPQTMFLTITLHQSQSKRPVFDDFWLFPRGETAFYGG